MANVKATISRISRVQSFIVGLLGGLTLIVFPSVQLIQSEVELIKETTALKEGAQNVVSVDVAQIDANNEGKLIHVVGKAETTDVLRDELFGVSVDALKLSRVVETYQWQEEERTSHGENRSRTFDYHKVWSSELIDSTKFAHPSNHENPKTIPVASADFFASDVALGAFKLPKRLIAKLPRKAELSYNPFVSKKTNRETKQRENQTSEETIAETPSESDDRVESASDSPANDEESPNVPEGFYPRGNGYYKGNPNFEQIGDVRVSFLYIPTPCEVAVVSRQVGDSFAPYQAKTDEVDLIVNKSFSADAMFNVARRDDKIPAWSLRLFFVVPTFFGFVFLFEPFVVLAESIPLIKKIVGLGKVPASVVLTLCYVSTTFGTVWLTYKPSVGVPALCLAVFMIVVLLTLANRQNDDSTRRVSEKYDRELNYK